MCGHGLMQWIAPVNRLFRDRLDGLVVNYLGLADQLRYALAPYIQRGGKGSPSIAKASPLTGHYAKALVPRLRFW
jgi:type I restriction enzyme R subunit